ncbi:MAG TPA: tRNA (guanine(10)-N(2))-dimethyltransferase, partial [Thermoplasmatales archaeon]|nr:tRNA (guanine(10)-N(2))-dimethyltransferase [Thermoplasmatales archaeon]
MEDLELKLITEGKTSLFVPHPAKAGKRGPGKNVGYGFYNPAMEFCRDVTILVVQWLVNKSNRQIRILDGLSASGIRGIRIAREVDGDFTVTLNDWNENAIELIKRNLEYNNIRNADIRCENINSLLCRERFHYIDIDPFGSPVPYLDIAIRAVLPHGIIAVTATDTATLCGVYPKTCIRRYGAIPMHFWAMHEIGLRILIGYICREAAKYDRSIEPVLSYATDHYMRVYVKVERGARRADRCLENVKKVEIEDLKLNKREAGPIWTGRLHDKVAVLELKKILRQKELGTSRDIEKLLDRALEEADMPMLFYTVDVLAKHFKVSPPKMNRIMKKLEIEGYRVTRTHFSDSAFKTDAPREIILK